VDSASNAVTSFGSAGGEPLTVEHVQVIAFYEPDTGTIRHMHMVTTLAGATRLSEDEALADAKRHGSRRRPLPEELEVAFSNDPAHGHRPHRIDPETKAFVPLDDY
jgi:hypothetical protein